MSLKMRHLLFLVAVVIVDAFVDHGDVSNNGDRRKGNLAQDWMSNLRGDGNRRTGNSGQDWMSNLRGDGNSGTGNSGQDWMSNLRGDGNRRTGNSGQDWMSNLRGDGNSGTGNSGQDWMSNLRGDGNRRTGNSGQDWMSNLRGDGNRRTGNSGQDWMSNLRGDGNSGTGNSAQDWMSNLRGDGNRRTGNSGQDWMSNLRGDGNSGTGNSGQDWMSNLRGDGNRRTGNLGEEWLVKVSKDKATNHQKDVNRETESSCPKDFVYSAKLKFCFKVIFERSSTHSAKTKCRQIVSGGRLVQPDSREKMAELTKYLNSNKHGGRSSFAIGSTMKGRGHFTWMDGSPMTYANWCPTSPNKGKPCVKLTSRRRGSDICMDDGCCYHRGNFICEKPIA